MKGFLEMYKNTEQHVLYTDDLAQPIMLKPISLMNSQQDNALYLYKETERKLKLLHAYYGLLDTDTQSLEKLVLCMAKEHVPGFKVEYPSGVSTKVVGSPPYWAGKEGVLLYANIYKLKKAGKSVLAACKNLSLNERYADIPYSSLNQRYYEVKRRWGKCHCASMDVILEKLSMVFDDKFLEGFLASYFPDGNALFNNKKIVVHMAKMLSKL